MRKPLIKPWFATKPASPLVGQTTEVSVQPTEIVVEFLDFDEPQDIPVPEGKPPVKALTIAQLVQVQGDKRTLLDTAAFPEKLSPVQKAEIAKQFAKVVNQPKSKRQLLIEAMKKKKVVELAAYRRDRKNRNKATAQAKRKSRR